MSRPDLNLLEQLLAYGPWWLLFAALAYGSARHALRWCVPLAHFTVAALIFYLDVRWIRGEMNRPGWNGVPSLDIAFLTGTLLRILLINTILLPLTAWGISRRKSTLATPSPS